MPRITRVRAMQHMPAVCLACKQAPSGPVVDLGELAVCNHDLRGYLCEGCTSECLAVLGMPRPQEVEQLRRELDRIKDTLTASREEVAGLQRELDAFEALRAVIADNEQTTVREVVIDTVGESAASETVDVPVEDPKPGLGYSDEFKAGALKLLAETGDVKAVAEEVGVAPATLRNWQKKQAEQA